MNRPYISSIVKSYLIDNDLDDEKYEEFNNHIVDTVSYMKENLECAYVTVHGMTKIEQQRYIYELLDDLSSVELVEEVIDPVTATVLGMLVFPVVVYFGYKNAFNMLSKLNDYFTENKINVLNFILKDKREIKRFEVVRKITSSNFSDCRKKVGVSKDFMSDNDIMNALTPDRKLAFGLKSNLDQEHFDKALGLRDCYLDYIISTIATVSTIYSKCLIETGEVSDQSVSTDHGMEALINYPVGENCQVLYDKLSDQHNAFLDILYVFFKDDPRERQNWIKRLDEKVRGAKRGEHLRPSAPMRKKAGFEKGKFVSRQDRGLSDRYVNPTGNAPGDNRKKRY